jgi:hypothetical protein
MERRWLEIICRSYQRGYFVETERLKRALYDKGEWEPGFAPSDIDGRLLHNENHPTLLGVWHADPATEWVAKCDLLIKYIRDRVSSAPFAEIKIADIARGIGSTELEVSLLIRLMPGFGHVTTSGASRRQGVQIPGEIHPYANMKLDRPEMVDDYLRYNGIEKRIRWWFGDVVDVFISHANSEREAALVVQELLKEAFGTDCEVFVSSDRNSMKPGDWFDQVVSNLKAAEVVLVLISEKSQERPWINYEAGVAEGVAKQQGDRGFATNILPLIIDGLSKGSVSWPLQHYQLCVLLEEGEIRWLLKRVGDLIGRSSNEVTTGTYIERLKLLAGITSSPHS